MKLLVPLGSFLLGGALLLAFAPLTAQAQATVSGQILTCGAAGTPNAVLPGASFTVSERPAPANDPNLGVRQTSVRISLPPGSLPPGLHGVHIHETGSCTNTTGACLGANGHWDRHFANPVAPATTPTDNSNSSPNGNHPFHLGDLQNIFINADGSGTLTTTTNRVAVTPGLPLSLNDADGSAFIIHAGSDNYCPDGVAGTAGANVACNSGGARSLCAVIFPPTR
ncbi:superoxide dismutase family protein [Anthocerotibacter panamensis]|uniref:superoxide dismutase family protein n=1 Tax=Anthocerotibacter panamensis TaxID=2857077 RepID=UPI001C4054B4|nr:superoxide dismutase family protein [Anthocerotibacter panamensis]